MTLFGGWEMPLSYTGILDEHRQVRTHAGLFDVSHMGEIEISGPQAEAAVQYLTINDVRSLQRGQLQYSAMCNDRGGILDDLTVYRLAADRFLLIVNATNTDKDLAWIEQHVGAGARVRDVSAAKGLLALQGPEAEAILQRLTPTDLAALPYYHATWSTVAGLEVLVSRSGYTGEDGFELLVAAEDAPALWEALMEAGEDFGLMPAGLGARDTLRLEARYLLYGTDMDETTNPFEVGLGWITKLDKGAFIGREALQRIKEAGVQRRLVGFVMEERGVPRMHYAVWHHDEAVGEVRSGTLSPTLGQGIGTALVRAACAKAGTELAVDIRGTKRRAPRCAPTFCSASGQALNEASRRGLWRSRQSSNTPKNTSGRGLRATAWWSASPTLPRRNWETSSMSSCPRWAKPSKPWAPLGWWSRSKRCRTSTRR
ncbi:MAG: aminomethyltransferase [Candidatus Tectimicrobiota bacterium]|nr:MAG: aminomethyltransferase [Candidatus Tectomicrobia bacterium]